LLAEAALGQAVTTRPTFAADPFTLGVASGDPAADGFVLWTKLAPRPLDPDGGMSADPVSVAWEVADDEAMTRIVQRGTAVATPKLGHSVHVEVAGLAPDRWYWYRFRAGDAETKPARARTMPAADVTPAKLAFAFASCQHLEGGLWTAYERMARDELDLVVHLGDYIYEGGGKDGGVRKHAGPTTITLEHYRQRHAQYKLDPLIQAVHAKAPWLVTWDDHEVTNDYANDYNGKPEGGEPAKFLKRRAGAYRAFYEFMPLRAVAMPKGPDMLLYRQVNFGRLASFNVLDTRQYRTRQPGKNRWQNPMEPAMLDANATIMGHAQRDWLKAKLAESNATWNVLAQQVMMMMMTRRGPDDAEGHHATLY
ncbi:alkaline phosphatase, partial [bacterium]